MKRGAQPFEPAFPKLTDPLLRDTISRPEAFERRWWVHHLRGNDDRTFPVGQRGKHLDKHAPKPFRLQPFIGATSSRLAGSTSSAMRSSPPFSCVGMFRDWSVPVTCARRSNAFS